MAHDRWHNMTKRNLTRIDIAQPEDDDDDDEGDDESDEYNDDDDEDDEGNKYDKGKVDDGEYDEDDSDEYNDDNDDDEEDDDDDHLGIFVVVVVIVIGALLGLGKEVSVEGVGNPVWREGSVERRQGFGVENQQITLLLLPVESQRHQNAVVL